MENRWQIWKIRRKLMKNQVVKCEFLKNMVAKLKNINNKYNGEMDDKIGKLEKINGIIGGKIIIFENMVAKLENLKNR